MRSIGLEIVRTADRLNFSAAVAVFSTDGPLPIYVIVHVRRQDMAALTRTVNIALKVYLILARKIFQIGVTKPLPTGVGRILDMLCQVLKYDVLCDGTVGG